MEGDAGTGRLTAGAQEPSDPGIESPTHTDAEATDHEPAAVSSEHDDAPLADATSADHRRPTRLGSGWAIAICVVLILLAGGAITGGYFALQANRQAADAARADEAALQAAKECVAATQAPDTAAMTVAQTKILECSTGDFGVQAGLFTSVIAEAYTAANATVAVDDLRAAVERHNDDGSINVLVAVRVRISNSAAADQQVGYRLRATMAFDEGQYRIAQLDQVNS